MRGVTTLFSGFLRRIADDEELCLIFLKELWPQLVGEQVARHTRPDGLSDGRLTVAVSSRAWRRELGPMGAGIARAVNQRWESRLIDRIEFVFRPME